MGMRRMDVSFLKLQALGNDYICLDHEKSQPPDEKHLPRLAKKICDRRLGVGGEGMIILSREDETGLSATIYSAQGTKGEECGAALQCAARYAYDSGRMTAKEFSIFRGQRSIALQVIDSSNIRQDLGPPFLLGGEEELKELPDMTFTKPVIIEKQEYSCTPVFIENPQAVLFVSAFGGNLHHLAKKIDHDPLFPEGTGSVSFVRLFSREEFQVRAWRRNENELHACPKTAAASLVAAALNGFSDREALVHLRGGDLFVEWNEASNHIFFTGPVEYVFSGNFYFEEH